MTLMIAEFVDGDFHDAATALLVKSSTSATSLVQYWQEH